MNHKTPHQQGMADAYYHRPHSPSYYAEDGVAVTIIDMSKEQITQYSKGYDSIDSMDKKDWR